MQSDIEHLTLCLFWNDYSVAELRKLMISVNKNVVHCHCAKCFLAGRRTGKKQQSVAGPCAFKAWFEEHLAALGLLVAFVDPSDACVCGGYYTTDAHLVHVIGGRDDWTIFAYGRRLWQARHSDDRELIKMKRLFEVLESEDDDA